MESDNISANRVNDRSLNRLQITNPAARKTPVEEQLRNNLEREDQMRILGKERSASVPLRTKTRKTSGVENNVTSLIC